MRHQEGDVIRPRDCVLMRAGNKKNELPYVAKVAQLWENPEDGRHLENHKKNIYKLRLVKFEMFTIFFVQWILKYFNNIYFFL